MFRPAQQTRGGGFCALMYDMREIEDADQRRERSRFDMREDGGADRADEEVIGAAGEER